MLEPLSKERCDSLEHRAAEFVAYATERAALERSSIDSAEFMKSIYNCDRYKQLIDFDTYLYTFTFNELYDIFDKELFPDQ
jgi:hypothetical protein